LLINPHFFQNWDFPKLLGLCQITVNDKRQCKRK
jgi:hypothetical protein